MIIHNAIVHYNDKKKDAKASTHKLANAVLSSNEQLRSMITDVDDNYRKKSAKAFGSFTGDGPFSQELGRYVKHRDAASFIAFSCNAMQLFKICIDSELFASGGYLLFTHYSRDDEESFMVAMLDHKQGSLINDDLTISPAIHLDMDSLHVAAKIAISEWLDGSEYYLSFMRGRRQYISQYFSRFLGCSEQIDSRKESEKLLRAITSFCSSNELNVEEADAIKQKVHEYCTKQDKAGEPVYLEDLASYIFPRKQDQRPFYDFISDEKYKLSDCFAPHMKSLKALKTFTYKSADFNISFSRHIYTNGNISYTPRTKMLKIKVDDKLHQRLVELENDVN